MGVFTMCDCQLETGMRYLPNYLGVTVKMDKKHSRTLVCHLTYKDLCLKGCLDILTLVYIAVLIRKYVSLMGLHVSLFQGFAFLPS